MKLNELFDDEFQQSLNPDLSKDDINGGRYKDLGVDINFKNPISNFLKKIRYFVPILDMCISREDQNHFIIKKNEILTFVIRNETFHVSISLYFRGMSNVDMCILYQKSDYRGDVIINDITTGDTEYCYIEDFDNLSVDATIDVLKNQFLPLLKRLGFRQDYYSNKNINLGRFN